MKRLFLTVGIPGAGKSTWVKEYQKKYPAMVIVSTDEIRKELTGTSCCDPNQNTMIHEEARKRVKHLLGEGKDVIVDSTNVELGEWVKYKQLDPNVLLTAKVFNVEPEEAFEREKNRERVVPLSVLEMKWQQLTHNKPFMPFIFNFII